MLKESITYHRTAIKEMKKENEILAGICSGLKSNLASTMRKLSKMNNNGPIGNEPVGNWINRVTSPAVRGPQRRSRRCNRTRELRRQRALKRSAKALQQRQRQRERKQRKRPAFYDGSRKDQRDRQA